MSTLKELGLCPLLSYVLNFKCTLSLSGTRWLQGVSRNTFDASYCSWFASQEFSEFSSAIGIHTIHASKIESLTYSGIVPTCRGQRSSAKVSRIMIPLRGAPWLWRRWDKIGWSLNVVEHVGTRGIFILVCISCIYQHILMYRHFLYILCTPTKRGQEVSL